ncbi:hypothetical protein M407DRAFT_4819 [Tulasnella calospora MUT 4182]|uniref:Amine oxidase domain-containing protein n=1 Tax=Tulasnella calospora MUT 4182 TaxID=1051891 RepID=A0A0C3QU74_9AGAM|nr:hypothetical protein M407DRAFT_4819 [Tulasnella calospora MUT 4182]
MSSRRFLYLFFAQLDIHQYNDLRQLQYGPSENIGVRFKTQWCRNGRTINGERLNIVGGQSYGDRRVRTVVYPPYGATLNPDTEPESKVLIASYSRTHDALRLGALISAGEKCKDQVKDLILRDLAAIHNMRYEDLEEQYIDHFGWDWQHDEYTQGAFTFFGPGEFSTIYKSLTRPAANGHIHFAGEALSVRHAWVVGALDSAWRAVKEVLWVSHPEKLPEFETKWGNNEEWIVSKWLKSKKGDSLPDAQHTIVQPDLVLCQMMAQLDIHQYNDLRQLQYGPSENIGVRFKTQWWRNGRTINGERLNIMREDGCLSVLWNHLNPGTEPESKVLIASYSRTHDALRLGALISAGEKCKDQVKGLILRDLAAIHNMRYEDLEEQYVDHFGWDWQHDEYTQGAFAFFGPGESSTIYKSLTRPAANGHIHFAGEALSVRHAWVVGALDSAWRAVKERSLDLVLCQMMVHVRHGRQQSFLLLPVLARHREPVMLKVVPFRNVTREAELDHAVVFPLREPLTLEAELYLLRSSPTMTFILPIGMKYAFGSELRRPSTPLLRRTQSRDITYTKYQKGRSSKFLNPALSSLKAVLLSFRERLPQQPLLVLSTMLFAFGPNDSWYFDNGKQNIWRGVVDELHGYLKNDDRFKAGKIRSLVIFPNGGFYMTTFYNSYAYARIPDALLKDIQSNCKFTDVQRIEIDQGNSATYLCRITPPDLMLQSNVVRKCLERAVNRYFGERIQEISLGYKGTFFIMGEDGMTDWSVASNWDWWDQKMKKGGIKNVYLSPYQARRAFIELSDGTWSGSFPDNWHDTIKEITAGGKSDGKD